METWGTLLTDIRADLQDTSAKPRWGDDTLYVFTKDKHGKVHSRKDMGVFFIPMTGKIMEGKS